MKITRNLNYRNAMYTMLSRSFLRSYLLVAKTEVNGLTDDMKRGAEQIMAEKKMVVRIPSTEEIEEIKSDFEVNHESKSLRDRIEDILIREDIPLANLETIIHMIEKAPNKDFDDESLSIFICGAKPMLCLG